MTAVPAKVAGVARGRAVLAAPARWQELATEILAAAAMAGVDEVYAWAAPRPLRPWPAQDQVDRPGRRDRGAGQRLSVSIAKREVAGEGRVAVTSAFAGPSEVVVVADETTPVEAAAIDVIVQADAKPRRAGVAGHVERGSSRADQRGGRRPDGEGGSTSGDRVDTGQERLLRLGP